MEFYKKAIEYLRCCNIPVNKRFIRERMESHPSYPALISFTETLDELGISYDALIINPEYLSEIKSPFLAHYNDNGNEYFEIIRKQEGSQYSKFLLEKKWDGIVLSIKEGEKVQNAIYNKTLISQVNARRINISIVFLVILFGCIKSFLNHGALGEILFIINFIGCLLSFSILMFNLGKGNSISDTFCSTEGNANCSKVLNSRFGKVSNWFGLGELAFSFFLSLLVAICLIDLNTNKLQNLIGIPILLGAIFTFFTVFQQAFIIKSWCKMCMVISVVIWINLLLLIGKFGSGVEISIDLLFFSLIMTFIFFFSLLATLISKKIISQLDFAGEERISYLKWKRDPVIFSSLLYNSRKISYSTWENDIILGNQDANIEIMVGCNPYCTPCANAHIAIDNLLTEFPEKIKIIVRFSIDKIDQNDKKIIAINQILFAEKKYKLMKEKVSYRPIDFWFKHMHLGRFNNEFGIEPQEINIDLLRSHSEWAKSSKIEFTPTIFINGFELPSKYNFKDIKEFIPFLSEKYSFESVVYNTDFNESMALRV
ncbi:MAG: thioredoxin domain-containing protein [Chitinophagaceae bacterium]|jgi:uncharacterized membrane protein/thiol-disulfide isomerase/thioredoxin|nr:thioredoxin domain-containing protein [Chitinophagaceae bacterium]